MEAEIERKVTDSLKLDANLSFVDTEDKITGEQIVDSTNWMGNASMIYQPLPDYALSMRYHFTGAPNRAPEDTRDRLDGNHTVDLAFNVFNLWKPGITFRAGAANVLDSRVMQPAPVNTYPGGFPRPGRKWWMKLSADF